MKINKLEVHPLAKLFPPLNDREKLELENSIKTIGLLEDITLYEDKILDGVHRYSACRNIGVEPRFNNLSDGISGEDYVLGKNIHRRHLSPAQKVNIALEFREKKGEKINIEKNLIEKLKKENKNDILIQNALMVREKKENEKIAKLIGTKPESIRQGIVIKDIAKKDLKIAADWENALIGKTTIEAVYRKATHTKSKKKKKKNDNKIKKTDALHEVAEQKKILTNKFSILFEQNQLIQEKYDNVVQSLKKILTDFKTDDNRDIEIKYNRLLEKLETLVDEINNRTEQKISFPSLKDLRKAELKIN